MKQTIEKNVELIGEEVLIPTECKVTEGKKEEDNQDDIQEDVIKKVR